MAVDPAADPTTADLNSSGNVVTFTVINNGQLDDDYTLSCSGTGGVTCTDVSPADVALGPGQGSGPVYVTFSVGATYGSIYLTATGEATNHGWYVVTSPTGTSAVSVTPTAGYDTVPPNGALDSVPYTVKNVGSQLTDTYRLTRTCTGVTCPTTNNPTPSVVTLGPGASVTAWIKFYNPVGSGSSLTLTATDTIGGVLQSSGTWNVIVMGPPTIALHNFNGSNLDRGLCLTFGAGEAAGVSCGDLFVTHAMPSYRTMNRDRQLTLFYSSATAAPRPTVAVWATQPAGQPAPTSVIARLLVSGVVRDSATFAPWASGATRQIVLGWITDTLSGLYPFTVSVRNVYSSGSYETTISDTLIVVNRAHSEFGAGWWLDGVEQLVLGQPGGNLLWLGGDGSAAEYHPAGTNRWARSLGVYRDTIVKTDSNYTRLLRHSVQVWFDLSGHHLRTFSSTGQTTLFRWWGNPLRLDSIIVPPQGAGATYRVGYDPNTYNATWLSDPGGRELALIISNGELTELHDPDYLSVARPVTFAYDASRRLTMRTGRRGYGTRYLYDSSFHVTQVHVPLSSAAGDSATTRFQWWDEQGLALGFPAGSRAAADTLAVRTVFNGPRTDVPDDTTTFKIDQWGAPVLIRDPAGAVTTIVRGDTGVPALPTRVQFGDGRIVTMSWDRRGNLLQERDSTSHLGAAGLPTQVSSWSYPTSDGDPARDSPLHVVGTDSLQTTFSYSSADLPIDVWYPNGHRTHLDYGTTQSTWGLVAAVTEDSVTVYDSARAGALLASPRTAFGYSALGNLISDTSAMGRVRHFDLDNATQLVHMFTDAAGHRTEYAYDHLNRLTDIWVHVEDAPADSGFINSLHTQYKYPSDLLDSIIDPRGVVRTFAYDAAGRLVDEWNDRHQRQTLYLDPAGLVDSISPYFFHDSANYRIRYTYDADNRVRKLQWPARDSSVRDSVQYTYDPLGRLLSATSSSWAVHRSYFATGAIKADSQGPNNFIRTYGYDAAGRRAWYDNGVPGNVNYRDSIWYHYSPATGDLQTVGVRWRGNTVSDSVGFTWDVLGRRSRVSYTTGGLVEFAYDADGNRRMVCGHHPGYVPGQTNVFKFGDHAVWVDADGLVRLSSDTGSTSASCAYTSTANNGDVSYTYDKRHELRLQQDHLDTAWNAYDAGGNIVRLRQSSGSTVLDRGFSYYDSTEYLYQVQKWNNPQQNVQYGDNGDGTRAWEVVYGASWAMPRSFYYDGLGRTAGIKDGGCSLITDFGTCAGSGNTIQTNCRYDAFNRLYTLCESQWNLGYDGDNVDRIGGDDYTAAGWSIVHGPGLDDPLMGFQGSTSIQIYFATDGQGRQYAMGYGNGTGMDSLTYNSNGLGYVGATDHSKPFQLQGRAFSPATGLSFYRNRFFDMGTGRFTQEDPIGVAGGLNVYAYAGNNPVSYTDPFGLCPPQDKIWTPACDKPLESAGIFDPTMWLAGGIAGGLRSLSAMLLGRVATGAVADATAAFSARALAGEVAEATGGSVAELGRSEGFRVTVEVGKRAVVARIKETGDFRVSISGLGSLTREGVLSSEQALTHLAGATASEVTRLMNAAVDLLKVRTP